jgi:hypothetical protein
MSTFAIDVSKLIMYIIYGLTLERLCRVDGVRGWRQQRFAASSFIFAVLP